LAFGFVLLESRIVELLDGRWEHLFAIDLHALGVAQVQIRDATWYETLTQVAVLY